MAGASEKARFFLEQSIPELKEWERKKIFSQDEISAITKKRSDFEHKIAARGPSPSDYARYAEFEINVDTLRKKRVKRLGIKSINHTGQRRILFLFDRATKKFPGDLALWMQYIDYTRKQRALKKLTQVLTSALRLHPQKADLWIYAARFALEENADMTEARSYMQRGLRFCKNSKNLWLEYTKLELLYISKIDARRQILGLDAKTTKPQQPDEQGFDSDVISLPRLTAEDIDPSTAPEEDIDEALLKRFELSPVLTGAIPIAIFDAAMSHFDHDEGLAKSFYDLVSDFSHIKSHEKILNHIVDDMLEYRKDVWQTMVCHVKVAIVGISTDSPELPSALGISIGRLRGYFSRSTQGHAIAGELKSWLDELLQHDDLDLALAKVIESTKLSLEDPVERASR